jgi:hypothetical protein
MSGFPHMLGFPADQRRFFRRLTQIFAVPAGNSAPICGKTPRQSAGKIRANLQEKSAPICGKIRTNLRETPRQSAGKSAPICGKLRVNLRETHTNLRETPHQSAGNSAPICGKNPR